MGFLEDHFVFIHVDVPPPRKDSMYANTNFKTKKALKEAVANGDEVRIHSPGPFPPKENGRESLEGPHYPQPHRWYADVDLVDGVVVKVR